MRILSWRELTVRLDGGVSNSVVTFADHTVSLVAAVSDQRRDGRPAVGFGFNSIGRFGQGGILRERMFPRLGEADPDDLLSEDGRCFDPVSVAAIAMRDEKPGGHGDRAGAVGALELAVWDLNAKLADEPAHAAIARSVGRPTDPQPVSVYAAGGYYHADDSLARLRSELDSYRAAGFDACKIKIGGASLAEDLARVEAALEVVGEGSKLAVDANGRFAVEDALACGEAIAPYALRWFEEPGDPLDYDLNRTLAEAYSRPIATGENLFGATDVENLVRFGGMREGVDVFQMDAGLSYGLSAYMQMVDHLEAKGFDRAQFHPHGGHLVNLHIVSGLGLGGCEAYPGVFQPFGGFPSSCPVMDGQVRPGDSPGFGLEHKPELLPYLRQLVEDL